MKTRTRALEIREAESCPRCRLLASAWTSQGFTRQGKAYCCPGCAEDTGCICKSRKDFKRRMLLILDDRLAARYGDEGEDEIINEGRHMNLKRLLYEGGVQTLKKNGKRGEQRLPGEKEAKPAHSEDAEKGTDNEYDQASKLQRELRSQARADAS